MSDGLRVLHVITDLRIGGAETMLVKLVGTLDPQRFPCAVVSLVSGGELAAPLRESGVTVRELGLRTGRPDPRGLVRLRRAVREFAPDVIQSWMYHANLATTLATWGRTVPVVWNIRAGLADLARSSRLTRAVVWAGARLSGRPRVVVHNSSTGRDQHAAAGYGPGNARVLPNGFDTERFRPDPAAAAALRRELGLPAGTPLVGWLGRNHRVKGADVFLDAVANLRARRPEVHAVGAGRGITTDDPSLAGLAGRPDLTGHVHLVGPRRDSPAFLAGLDVLCSSSRSEGFPNVLGEALACGTPCVATDVGESRIILEGVGRVVPPADPAALAEALADVLALDADERAALGGRGRERVRERYSLTAVADAYARLYEDVAGGSA